MECGDLESGTISPAGREGGVKKGEEEGGRRGMCEAVERYAERYAEKYAEMKVAIKVKEERNLMTQIVAALVADKDNDTIAMGK